MCNYCGTKHHRKIYENHHGTIPIDSQGRTYDIHHLDGNHSNNDPSNLTALTIQEHYDIHNSQGDYGACIALAKRMKLTPEERSALATKQQLERSKNGTHHFLGGELSRTVAKKRIESGEFQQTSRNTQLKKVKDGTHPFLKQNRKLNMLNPNNSFLLGKFGLDHPKSDKKIHSLTNIETHEVRSGTRSELKEMCGLNDNHLSRLIKGRNKTQLNWKIV